jgi:DNA adenine methylase
MKVKPIICRAGGKTRLLKHLLPLVPVDAKCYVEVFGGGAALLLAREPKAVEVYNDLDGQLVNLFRQAKFHHPELLRELEFLPASREEFNRLRHAPGLTEIQRAAHFLYVNKISFGGKNGTYGTNTTSGGGASNSKLGWCEALKAFSVRFDKVNIECEDWRDLLKRYDRPHTFFFFDPPYINSGENVGYVAWCPAEMAAFAAVLPGLKGRWLLTTCDSPECREIFGDTHIREVERKNGIENRTGKGKNAQYKELIITPRDS